MDIVGKGILEEYKRVIIKKRDTMKNINLYFIALTFGAQTLFGAATRGENFIDAHGNPRPKGSLSQKQLNFGESARADQSGLRTSLTFFNNHALEKIVAATAVLDRDDNGRLMLQLVKMTCPVDHQNFKVEWIRERKSILGDEGFVTGVKNIPSGCVVSAGAVPIFGVNNYYNPDELGGLLFDLGSLSKKQ